jgi:hypothetical protein
VKTLRGASQVKLSETYASFLRRLTFVSAADFVWTSVTGALSADCFGGFTFKAKETEEEGTSILVPSPIASSLL